MGERVWDRFLTDQDRAHLQLRPKRRTPPGRRPALLLVDLYRWVFGDSPQPLLEAVPDWPGSCGPAGWEAIPHIQRLLDEARELGMPVIHVTGMGEIPSWSDGGREEPRSEAERDRRRRRYEIVDEVQPLPGEPTLRKSAPSAFWGTPLAGYLHGLGVDTIVVAGESTSGCVRATVVDGRSHRYKMLVVEECVFDRHEATHALNLFDMDQKYADVIPLDEAVAYMREHSPMTASAV